MTRPMGEPNTGVRMGKAQSAIRQLQRRPTMVPSSGTNISASFISGNRSRSMTGGQYTIMDFTSLESNDASFGYLVTSAGPPVRAKYIEITQTGFYMAQGHVTNDESTPYTGTDFPYIEILVYDPDSATFSELINSKDIPGWDDGQSPIYGEMLSSTEYAHQQMVQTIWFNFDTGWFGSPGNSIGLGVGVAPQNNITLTVGGGLVVTRIGELMTSTTVV